MKAPAGRNWMAESNVVGDPEVYYQKRWDDPCTGVQIYRLTTQPLINSHIYPEAPVSSPDGRRFIFRRGVPGTYNHDYWIGDTETLRIRRVTDEPGAMAPIYAPDGESLYYQVGQKILRMSPETFEREELFEVPPEHKISGGISSVSHCGARFLAACGEQRAINYIVKIDLAKGCVERAFQHEFPSGHQQYCRHNDYRIMVQVNDGLELDANGDLVKLVGENGASLHVLNDDGSEHSILGVGCSPLEHVQGHECWVSGRNEILTTTHRRDSTDELWTQDTIVASVPGENEYRVVGRGEGFTHIHCHPTGRYWVSDCNRTARVYVGSVATGRYKLFVNTGSTFGVSQFTHPHPFFIGSTCIGWNSDVTGIPHVYFAPLTEGFLDGLE